MRKAFGLLIAVMMSVTAAACGAAGDGRSAGDDAVTIRVFSNLPDRSNGQGLVEQYLFDQYVAENPHIAIEVEALHDEDYKTKMMAYAAGTDLPDLVSVWGHPSFLDEYVDAGILAALNPADYDGYGFVEGSFSGFSKDGVLYGLPRNTDMMVFYYNKQLFDENDWDVPATYEELLALAAPIGAAGFVPVAMTGGDKWPIAIYMTDLLVKVAGPAAYQTNTLRAIADNDFSNPMFARAVALLQDAYDASLFQVGFETQDYGTAQNLFVNGGAAMYYMGSWEMSMANNDSIPAEVRDNIRAFTMPVVSGGAGGANDITAWNGGGHAVVAGSPVQDEAVKLLNYMYLPENWTRIAWENNVGMTAQDFSQYATGDETPVQIQLMEIFANATGISGTTINDLGSAAFKVRSEDAFQEAAIKRFAPGEIADRLQ